MSNKVFVYGTLRQKDSSETHVLEDYAMINLGPYPYIIPAQFDQCAVVGNVVEVSDEDLEWMDRYEGLNKGLYTREKVRVLPVKGGKGEEVWAYIGGPSLPKIVWSGDWFDQKK